MGSHHNHANAITQQQLADFLTYVPGAMYQYRLTPEGKGVFDYASDGIEELFGCPVEDMLADAEKLFTYIHPDDLEALFDETHRQAKEGGLWQMRFRVMHPVDGERWIQGYSRPEALDDGTVRFHGHFKDVTEEEQYKKQNEQYQKKLNDNSRLLMSIFDHMPAGIWLLDKEGNMRISNRWFQEHYQVTGEERSACQQGDLEALESEVPIMKEETVHFSDGKPHTIKSVKLRLTNEDGEVDGVLGIGMDISDYKQVEDELFIEKETLKTTLMSMGDGVIATDEDGLVVLMNPIAERLTGYTFKEAKGQPFDKVFYIIDEHSREKHDSLVYEILKTGRTLELEKDTLLMNKYGKEIPVEDSAAPIRNSEGQVKGAVVVFRDHTAEKERIRQIEYLSFHDQLTDLYNRRFLEEELKRLNTDRNFPLSVLVMDVNGLKLMNDAFGHSKGDELLKKVAQIIRQQTRADDIIARVGGDEFTILLPKTSMKEVEIVVDRISTGLSRFKVGGMPVTASFGWEAKHRREEPTEHILKKAEEKMYRQKMENKQKLAQEAVETIMRTFFDGFPNEEEHAERVGVLAEMIGSRMGVDRLRLQELKLAGIVHDIGKVALPFEMMLKADALSDEERAEIERHPEVGYNILNAVNHYGNLSETVLAHHEWWDGSGYPKGLKGEDIPLQARIIAVAEAYETMTTPQAYREAMLEEEALRILKEQAGKQFDPKVVEEFIEIRES